MNERNLPQLLNKKRILITGVSGLIGRILFNHLTDHHSNQYEVFGLDQHTHISSRYANQSIESTYPLSQEKFFQCDITDRDKLHQFIANEHIEIIIHLAAVLETHPDLDYIYHVNIQGTKNVFEARRSLSLFDIRMKIVFFQRVLNEFFLQVLFELFSVI